MNTTQSYGIEGLKAPEWNIKVWVDENGNKRNPIQLSDLKGKFKVIYCFQSWCPGCHSIGLPSLQAMTKALKENKNIQFLAIQTVFEGNSSNTYEKMLEIQKKYNLKIPFAQDNGNSSTNNISNIMVNYRTGGTPWFIFIDQNDNVVFNDYHLDTEKAISYLKQIK
ncbi:peroxiredoxin family protein [Flavobacterium oreochromis]|uniref:Thiol-disulfide isomerase n=2 Tax=Flavobacterium TaxID=237 RepID=A0A246GDN5_9FLAO|nr:TlpA disulfide reductase family protein [Flavobacterium oreochromis]OWP74377.1 thiol-disulfide isomerase [Flavobacterium oreochromis]OWP79428.1 thiol-disulfide isomerase [Flavobacterium oreochromis]QYS87892.1 redoxin family protein [Flavobacterium oreochromis]